MILLRHCKHLLVVVYTSLSRNMAMCLILFKGLLENRLPYSTATHTHAWLLDLVVALTCKRKITPLRASQSLSETFPCTDYKTFSPKGKALRWNGVARIGT